MTGTEIPADPESTWGEELRARLDDAVRRRLVADVPVGVFLSGGIDSSAVTAFASRHVPAGQLKTFCIGFEEASFDESAYARRVAELFKTDHHLETLSITKAHSLLPAIARRLDEPMGDSSLLPTYLLSQFTRTQVKVALGGDAGDELFAGYDPFVALRKAELYSKLVPRPCTGRSACSRPRMPVSHRYMSFDFRLKRTLRGLSYPPKLWLPVWTASLDAAELAELFGEPADLEDIFSEAIAAWEGCAQPDAVDRTLQFFTKLYLQDDILVKVDRATMMHGLEARAPFLDIDFVNFARRIPSAWKYRHGQTKYILKKALEPVLPADVLYRKKQGFGVPIGAWFKNGQLSVGDAPLAFLNNAFVQGEARRAPRRPHRPTRLPLECVDARPMVARLIDAPSRPRVMNSSAPAVPLRWPERWRTQTRRAEARPPVRPESSLRILLINYEYPPVGAGAATATQAIARSLAASGHPSTVLTAGIGTSSGRARTRACASFAWPRNGGDSSPRRSPRWFRSCFTPRAPCAVSSTRRTY